MSVIYVMIPLAFLLALAAVAAFVWAARSGQYDDVDSAAARMITDDDNDGRTEGPNRARNGSVH